MSSIFFKTVAAAALAAIVVAIGYLVLGKTAAGRTSQNAQVARGPLVPADMVPKDVSEVSWFLMSNRLVTREDDPEAVRLLLATLREPVPFLRYDPPPRAQLSWPFGHPFMVGMGDGSVLLADLERVSRRLGTSGKALWDRLKAMVPSSVSFQPDTEWDLAITPSERFRLGVVRWHLEAVWDEESMAWKAEAAISEDAQRRVTDALSQTRNVHALVETTRKMLRDTHEKAGARSGRTSWPPCKVSFDAPVPVTIVSLDDWDPLYYRRGEHSGSPPIQAYLVKPQKRFVDQAIIEPQDLHEDTARVCLRFSDSKLWFSAGVVPLRYP